MFLVMFLTYFTKGLNKLSKDFKLAGKFQYKVVLLL